MKVKAFNKDISNYIEFSAVISREETYVKHSVYRMEITVDMLGIPDDKISDVDKAIESAVNQLFDTLKVSLKDKSDFDKEHTEENGDSHIVVDKTAITIKSPRINLESDRCSQIS